MDFKDIQVLISFGLVFSSVIMSQIFLFPNLFKNFDPDIFIYVYGAFGVITWLLYKIRREYHINHIMAFFFLTRIGILAFQSVCFLAGSFYNVVNEVAYYDKPLAAVLIDPDYFSIYQYAKYGMPPGFQFWLLAYNAIIFSNLSGFFRDFIFSLFNIAFDFGTMYVMVKIFNSGMLNRLSRGEGECQKDHFQFGLFFYSISIFSLYYNNVRNFMDIIPIFLAMAGIFFYGKNKHVLSSLCISISILMKFIPIFWLLLIILKFMKEKNLKVVAVYVATAAITAIAGFLASALFFGENPFYYFQQFFPQFYKWSRLSGDGIQLNQAFWYTVYDSTFFVVGLIAILILAILFTWKEKNGPTLHAFTAITSIYFIFQPWYDQRYILWILPFLCLDLLSSKRNFATIIILFYISIFMYLFFMHVPNNLGIDTRITSPTRLVGDLYRVTGQFISYTGFGATIVLYIKQAFSRMNGRGIVLLNRDK